MGGLKTNRQKPNFQTHVILKLKNVLVKIKCAEFVKKINKRINS